jgi:hypothetical protein
LRDNTIETASVTLTGAAFFSVSFICNESI